MTQQDEGVQRQSLFLSTDGGYRFEPIDGNPVMDNPGATHWRDPKIVWDDARDEWLMVLAEGHKLGFYTSPDLKDWTYRSGFERDDLGILECPDLFEMSLDGDAGKTTWVLAAGVNGAEHGKTTGTVYWTGEWDGEAFTAEAAEPAVARPRRRLLRDRHLGRPSPARGGAAREAIRDRLAQQLGLRRRPAHRGLARRKRLARA